MSSKFPTISGAVRTSLLLAALSCATASAVSVSYQYYRFTPIKLRNDATANSVAISEFQLLSGGVPVVTTGATVTTAYGNNPAAEVPANLIDSTTATKWLDFNRAAFTVAFPAAVTVDAYRFSTANDATERDPLRWTLEGSADGATWTLLDHLTTDFATPTARLATTSDIPLPATADPIARDWIGNVSNLWDTTTGNWSSAGTAVTWDNTRFDIAHFPATSPTTLSVSEPVVARKLDFSGANYSIQGGTLTLSSTTPFMGNGSADISSVVAGTLGVIKTSPVSITLSGNNTFTGAVAAREGLLTLTGTNAYAGATTVSGGALAFDGVATKTAAAGLTVGDGSGKGLLSIGGTSKVVFNGSPLVGTAGGSGVIRQTGGTATYASANVYLTLGNNAASYSGYEMSGGSMSTVDTAGIRVGWLGQSQYTQSGGDVVCGRWFAIGGANSTGVATFTGGTASIAAGYRVLIGDQGGSSGTFNLGTAAGGNAVVTPLRTATAAGDGAIAVSAGSNTGVLNLNSGVLNLNARIFKGSGTGTVNLNGGTLRPAATGVDLMNNSLTTVKMYRGGLIVDTDGKDATMGAPILEAFDQGIYPSGGTFAMAAAKGGSGYIGAPLVSITTDGSGVGASAIATVSGGKITGVVMTCPGETYAAGDTLTFTFTGGGADTPADPVSHTLTPAEVASNNNLGLTKTGAGKLTATMATSYPGATTVAAGTLVANASMDVTPITVAAGATLAGDLDATGPLVVNGTLSPGADAGQMTFAGNGKFNAGSTYAMQIRDWTGDAGVGYDTAFFGSMTFAGTSASKFTLNVDGTGILNFTEAARQFTVATSGATPSGLLTNTWQVTTTNFPGTGTWSLSVTSKNVILSYQPGAATGYSAWAAGFSGLADKSQSGDPDGDGISNVMEYVLNGNPGVASTTILPTMSLSSGNSLFTFVRRAESKNDTTQAFEYGSTLTGWTAIPIPAATNASVTITPNQPSSGLETVVVTLPAGTAVGGRLFGRLSVTTP